LSSLPFILESVSLWPPSIKFLEFQSWSQLPVDILHKLPLLIPLLWITYFVSSRRSEALRLQQEYAHKEAIAKSFESFKKQINELRDNKTEKEVLMTKLLGVAIDAIAFNASNTLDGKHKDKTPFDSLIDPISKIISEIPKNGLSVDINKSK
jgi:DNA polymerase I-like protein with 3'-5' exonuclease and polymerase domains